MKQFRYLIGGLLLSLFVVTSCSDDDDEKHPWDYEITEVRATSDIPVGALLYNAAEGWNDDTRWNRITNPYDAKTGEVGPYLMPEQGQYKIMGTDAAGAEDRATALGKIVEWAKEARIDFLVTPSVRENANAYYPGNLNREDSVFIDLLSGRTDTLGWKNDGSMKYAISINVEDFANNAGCSNNNSLLEKEKVESQREYTVNGEKFKVSAENRLYLYMKRISHYFKDATYQHVNGKPLLVFLGSEKLYCEDVKTIYDNIRAAIKEETGKDVFIMARQKSWEPTARFEYFFLKGKVDAITMRNMCNVGSAYWERTYKLNVFINENFKENKKYMQSAHPDIDFIPSVSPGYLQYVWDGNLNYPMVHANLDQFRARCWVAKMHLGNNPMVIVDAFNQWGFGNQIEPTVADYGRGYGHGYLDIIREEFKK